MQIKNKFMLSCISLSIVLFSGCSTVPLEPNNVSTEAKSFNLPPQGQAGIYVYRDSLFGAALKKDIWIDNKCLGSSAPEVFFYKTVEGDKKHTVATESEFSPNKLTLRTKSGKNYFVRQYIKMGAFTGGADLELVDEETGKKAIKKLKMAKKGICRKASPDE